MIDLSICLIQSCDICQSDWMLSLCREKWLKNMQIAWTTRKQLAISIRKKFGYIGKVIWTVAVTLASLKERIESVYVCSRTKSRAYWWAVTVARKKSYNKVARMSCVCKIRRALANQNTTTECSWHVRQPINGCWRWHPVQLDFLPA